MARPYIPRRSVGRGVVAGAALVGVVTLALIPFRDGLSRASPALALVVPVVAAAVLGGRIAAALTAVVATVAANLAFVPPYGTLKVDVAGDAVALAVFVVVALVVGALVAAEADRRRAAEQRAREVEALNGRLEEAASERERLLADVTRVAVLEQVDQQRAALLRSVSHDLRTPLATIRAVASDLRSGADYDDGTRVELLTTVCDEAERLDRLVANLLSMSRIEAGSLRPDRQAVDLEELVTDRVRRLGGLFRQVRIHVDLQAGLPYVDGDYTQLDQVLTNLLENAARHAPLGSTVRLDARAAGPAGEHVEIRVSDEGIGVPEWERNRLFEPFRRGEGSTSSGIGLAICAAIVEAHGGSIGVERTPGGGATFVVRLPARFAVPARLVDTPP